MNIVFFHNSKSPASVVFKVKAVLLNLIPFLLQSLPSTKINILTGILFRCGQIFIHTVTIAMEKVS